MSPHETLFLEGTNSLDIKYIANNSFVQFQIWDFPGDYDFKGKARPTDCGEGSMDDNEPAEDQRMPAMDYGQTTWCTADSW